MSEGTLFRDHFTFAINKDGSALTIIPITLTESDNGGYEGRVETAGTSVSTKGLPSRNFRIDNGEKFGKLEEGDCTIVVKGTETVAKGYKITWNGANWKIRDYRRVVYADVVAGYVLLLRRDLDDNQ